MHTNVAIMVSVLVGSIGAQFLAPQYAALGVPQQEIPAAHQDVVFNAQMEAQLPRELLKSAKFYDNPAIAAALARESLPTNKEMATYHREAANIPREQVLKIVKNAGFVQKR